MHVQLLVDLSHALVLYALEASESHWLFPNIGI
jgi:hypothetical protein